MSENLINGDHPLLAQPVVESIKPKAKTKTMTRKRRNTKSLDTPALGVYRMDEDVQMPHLATEQSACFDMRAHLKIGNIVTIYDVNNKKLERKVNYYGAEISGPGIVLNPGDRILMPTGIIFDIPEGYSVRAHPRSGCALKESLTLINGEGVIDSDYVHECYMPLVNHSGVRVFIKDGERCAQVEMIENLKYDIGEVLNKPSQKTSRAGGFGHSGKK